MASDQNNWLEIIVGLIAGHFVSRIVWGLLIWIVSLSNHTSPAGFLFLYGVAVVCAFGAWGLGYVGVYAFVPKCAKISAALSGMVGVYVALALFFHGFFGWARWFYQSASPWPGFLL